MASTAGSIVLGIFADIAQLKTDLGRANQNIDAFASKATSSLTTLTKMATGFASAFAGIGLGLGAASFASLIKSTAEAADEIGDLSERLGISTDLLQAYQYAAKQAGSSTETVSTAFAKFNQLLGEATAGEDEAIKLFARLGIATKDAAGNAKTTEAAFRELADKIQAAGSVADKTAIAKKFLGKAGAELVPIFAEGAAGADKLTVKLREMGILAEGNTIRQLGALDEKFGLLSKAMSVTMMEAVVTLQPQLLALGGAFITAARGAAQLFEWFTPNAIASLDLIARRVKETREQIDREIAGRAQGGVSGWIFGLGSAKREAGFRKREADLLDLADLAREKQTAPTPKTGGGLGDDPDKAAAAAKKAAAEQAKIREHDLDAIAYNALLTDKVNQQAADDLHARYREEAAREKDSATALAEEAERVASRFAEEAKWRDQIEADRKAVAAEAAELQDKEREAYLAGVKQKADAEAELDAIKKDYYEKEQARLDADLARREAMFDKFFAPFTRAFEASVTGVIQGTITLEKAFQNMGQSIAVSLGETAIKEGVDQLKKALKALLESELVKDLIRRGIGIVGGAFAGGAGAGAGVTVAPQQTINYDVGAQWLAAGGIVQSPTFAVVGEAGPEAVVPLDRMGEMGGNVTVNIIDQRSSGNVEQRENTSPTGQRSIDVFITDAVKQGFAAGAFDRSLASNYGVNRRGVAR